MYSTAVRNSLKISKLHKYLVDEYGACLTLKYPKCKLFHILFYYVKSIIIYSKK
jgi:hypothetical protein